MLQTKLQPGIDILPYRYRICYITLQYLHGLSLP